MKYAGLGFQLLGTIGFFGWMGHLADQHFNLEFPVFLLSLVMIAFVGNMVILYRSVTRDK